jgi:multidrug efflux pump subunit AcrA (membrane-fusion protein)
MSQLGKILFYVALAGAFVALVAGGFIVKKGEDDKAIIDKTTGERNAAQQLAKKEQAENAALTLAKAQSDKDLADAKTQLSDTTDKLTAAQKQASDAAALVQTATDTAKAAQDKLDGITKTLNGKTAQQIVDAEAKAEADLTAAQSEQKILQDNLDDSKKQVADLYDAINRSKNGGKMPGVSGKITFVDHAWNFVILDVGLAAGVVPNGELIVYRDKTFLGKVRVTKVDPNDAVAEILPDVKGDIQIGDKVLN